MTSGITGVLTHADFKDDPGTKGHPMSSQGSIQGKGSFLSLQAHENSEKHDTCVSSICHLH